MARRLRSEFRREWAEGRRGLNMTTLERLKSLAIEGLDLDEAVHLSMVAGQLREHYGNLQLESPDWLDTRIRELRREIKTRTADALEKRLKEAKARFESLKPASERRDEAAAEIKKLEEMLTVQP